MNQYEVRGELLKRIPESATGIKFVEMRAYFTMPREWVPSEGSGVMKARAHRPIQGKRWQVRL